ncbi:COG1470 family protein [Infirmifilum sp. SLHALR2]
MKRILLLALAVLALSALAQPLLVRHVDPSLVPESGPDALALARLYLSYSSYLAGFDVASARNLLANASAVYVPERYRAAYQRLRELLDSYTGAINESKALLDLAEALYVKGDFGASLAVLGNASTSLSVAEIRYSYVESAVEVLRSLGLPGNVLGQMTSNLRYPLDVLKERYVALRDKVREALETAVGTSLELEVSSSEVLYGEYLGVSGRLASVEGSGVPGKTVYVYLDSERYTTVTDSEGYFRLWIPVRVYQSPVRVYGEFLSDGFYKYARSRDVYVKVVFYEPGLEAWLDNQTCLPGRSFSLHVRADEGLEVSVEGPFGFNASFASNGSVYSFSIPVPASAREGTYTIRVASSPRGVIAPGLVTLRVSVARITPRVEVRAPNFILTGFTYDVSVSPSVESRLDVYTAPGVFTYVQGYNVSLSVPHTYLDRRLRVVLHVSPLDPGYRAVDLGLELPVYNVFVFLVAGGVLVFVALALLPRGSSGGPLSPPLEEALPAGAASRRGGEVREDGLRGLFQSLMELLERLSGVRFEPSYTIREYLGAVRGRVSETLWNPIRFFMLRLEAVLYSQLEGERALIERIIRAFVSTLGGGG